MMQPDFEQLLQIIRVAAKNAQLDFIRVVRASEDGDFSFLEVTDGADFRNELAGFVGRGMLPLGLLGWELNQEFSVPVA